MNRCVVVSMPKGTTLRELETHAARTYGGTWKVSPEAQDCWRDEENSANFCWVLTKGPEVTQ